jgi:hypothetical protein
MKKANLWIVLGLILTGCAKIDRDISKDPIVSSMVGRSYQTKKDLLIYVFDDAKKKIRIHQFGHGPDFPDQLSGNGKFPERYYGTLILGVFPVGSEFQISEVKEEGNTGMSFIVYKANITSCSDDAWVGKEIYVEDLANPLKMPPVFDDDLVREIIMTSGEGSFSLPPK